MKISNLPDELITDILTRFPVKFITQFKCVCKSWCSLISTTHFVQFHLNRVIHDSNFRSNRILHSSFPLQSFDYEPFSDNRPDYNTWHNFLTTAVLYYIRIVGSCYGLLCVILDYDNIVICNPSIQEFVQVPKAGVLEAHGFDYRFGYDSSGHDYKLVRAVQASAEVVSSRISAEMFSLRSLCWNTIDDVQISIGINEPGTLSDGLLHWVVTGKIDGDENVSFDLETEVYSGSVWLPKQGEDDSTSLFKLDVLQGCIWMIYDHVTVDPEIWVRKQYGVEASDIRLSTILREDVEFEYCIEPICSTKNGEIVMVFDEREFVMYNSQESTFRKTDLVDIWESFDTCLYVETLVSPRIGQERH